MSYHFEVAVDSLESALIAESCAAHRIELCADLGSGGITPSTGMIQLALAKLDIPVHVMIRPRRGDFLYSASEFAVMQRDIEVAKLAGADGVVFGILLEDGRVDAERVQALIDLARPLHVTFHRAFDMSRDLYRALDDLMRLGVDTVLTSGQEATAEAGLTMISALVKRAGRDICVMPGSGINPANIRKIAQVSGATDFHFSGRQTVESPMRYRNQQLSLTDTGLASEYQRIHASEERLRATIEALD